MLDQEINTPNHFQLKKNNMQDQNPNDLQLK